MKFAKIFFSVVFLLMLASNVRLISAWSESRGVYDDICYLRQSHLFQRFGWQGLDTNLAHDDDAFLARELRDIRFPTWSDVTTAPCHEKTADGSKRVLTPPPGTGFILSLFPEGFQVVPLYVLANVIIAGFAVYGLWRAQQPRSLAITAAFGAIAIYFMINPTKASYSMAPTMVVCALAGMLTAKLFIDEDRPRPLTVAAVGLLLGISASFRLANVLLSAGYFLFLGISFLIGRNRQSFLQGFSFTVAFLIGLVPMLAANMINAGSPFSTTYGGADAVPPRLDAGVLRDYLMDTQFPVIVLVCGWTGLLWHFVRQSGAKRVSLIVASNLAMNLAFFATHPVFTQYYTIPISMLSLWTLLFATILVAHETQGAAADTSAFLESGSPEQGLRSAS